MKKILLVLLCVPTFLFAQYQIGQNINGVTNPAGCQAGESISISGDGSVIVVGEPDYNSYGRVIVYNYNLNMWSQIGQAIDGFQDIIFGGDSTVNLGDVTSINSDGSIIAVADKEFSVNKGRVWVYQNINNSWQQLGQPIYGNGNSQYTLNISIALSSDGNTLVVGWDNDETGGGGFATGKVRVFNWNGINWIQKGSDIIGNGLEMIGYDVDIDSIGNVIAIGSIKHSVSGTSEEGCVKVYEWNGNNWSQRGVNIVGEAPADQSGFSISLSGDGNNIAIGAPFNDGFDNNAGHVRIYNYNGNSWIQMGQDIDGEKDQDRSGWSVSLSNNGNTVAIGSPYNDGANNWGTTGHTRVYSLSGTNWQQICGDIDGSSGGDYFGKSVSLNNDGNILAIGSPGNDDNGNLAGQVRVLGFNGCTDSNFVEYIDGAIFDDGSCVTPVILGCTDSTAYTYNSIANTDDGSCCYSIYDDIIIGGLFFDSQLGQHSGGSENKRASISYDGTRFAIGMTDSSEVIVMQWDGISWQSYGFPIQFSDPKRVAISGNGNVVAVGQNSFFNIYEYSSGTWTMTFSGGSITIDGPLELNYIGDYIIAGGSNEVKVYRKDGNIWNLDNYISFSQNPISGVQVDIDSVGNTIVVGRSNGQVNGPGYVEVYERISVNNWIQKGSNISSTTNNYSFGYGVSISADGNTIAGGGYASAAASGGINSCGSNAGSGGHVEVYEYVSGTGNWHQIGSTICGSSGGSYGDHMAYVSLSNDGESLVTSSYYDLYGNTKHYRLDANQWIYKNAWTGYSKISGSGKFAINETGSFGQPNANVRKFLLECPTGCTDLLALNFDPVAVMDDGSCCYDCGKIEGFIYEDADTSATFDSIVETPLGPQIIQLEKSSGEFSYLTSQTDGYYSFVVDTGQQVITYSPPAFWESSNNNTQYAIDIQTDSTYSGLDFGIIPEFTKGDMTVDITTSNTVCNNTTTIWLTVRNEGTETITNVDLDLWVDPAYSISNTGGGSQNGNHISWNFPGDFYPYIYTGEEQTFSVDVQIPSGPQGGSFVDSVRVTPVQFNLIEIDLNNNFGRADNSLLCSYDPNDKQVLPKKCFYNELDTLDFTIRFQNTGNYPATTVTLVDSLDLDKLDIMSFHVLGASHDYEWSLKVPSVLEVVFDNIMLVDSSVSFNESQGFFKYRIIVRDSLADLQPSATPAFIYFDLNAPVVTNLPEINFVSNLSANLQSTNSSCNGSNNGTATLNIASVTAPYTIAWNGGDTTSSLSNLAVGTYSVTLTDDKTCVYTDSVSITEPNAIASSNSQSICDGQSITIGSNTYNTSGTYTDVLSALNGCDSTVTTNLTVLANTSSNTTLSSCDPVNWNGQTYNSSGNYSFTTTNSNGCDSTATLDLTINSTSSSSSAESSCDNYSWNGNTYNSSGTYSWVGSNSNGCDSTATLNLTINSTSSSSSAESSCDNYSWNGNNYNSSGTYSWVGSNSNGCDSTATLNLTINSTYSSNNNLSICFGESVTVGGNTYNQTGTYNDTLTAVNGCDSTVTTNLTIYSDVVSIISQSGNDITVTTIGGTSPYSYQWNTSETTQTITPLANGDYWVIITDMNSCESDTAFFTVNWITTSINEINLNNLTIYPNPSKDIFNIVFNTNTKQDIDLRVHNVLGEVIFGESLKNFNGEYNRSVDLSQYPNAIYILQLNTKDGMINKKLLLEK